MKNPKFKIFQFLILALPFAFLILNFFGCATVPAVRETFQTYNLNGTTYYTVLSLCNVRWIDWQYDTFTRSIALSKDSHKVNLRAHDTLVLVDGNPLNLDQPVDIYQGTIVVPAEFKEKVVDVLFREIIPAQAKIFAVCKIKKVVIDSGHGGTDPGAIGKTGLQEKDVNLDIAKRIAGILKSSGIEVVMTRTTDNFVPLSTRARIANSSGADLFVSVHSNANRVRSLNGFETYYVAPTVSDSSRALLSARNATLNLDSRCFASSSQDLKAIIWDMVYTNARAESIELAGSISRSMDGNLDAKVLGIKGARFQVLREVRMPAVLVEVGFVSNSEEEHLLRNSFYREKIAESIAEGICVYAKDSSITEAANR